MVSPSRLKWSDHISFLCIYLQLPLSNSMYVLTILIDCWKSVISSHKSTFLWHSITPNRKIWCSNFSIKCDQNTAKVIKNLIHFFLNILFLRLNVHTIFCILSFASFRNCSNNFPQMSLFIVAFYYEKVRLSLTPPFFWTAALRVILFFPLTPSL